jgi:hypothetical protein
LGGFAVPVADSFGESKSGALYEPLTFAHPDAQAVLVVQDLSMVARVPEGLVCDRVPGRSRGLDL